MGARRSPVLLLVTGTLQACVDERNDMTTESTNPAWPYLVFAEQLEAGLAARADAITAYRHDVPTTTAVAGDPVDEFHRQLEVSGVIVSRLEDIFAPTAVVAAFGDATHPSHEDGIRHIADQLTALYGDLINWARATLGLEVPAEYQLIAQALAHFVRKPIRQIEEFCADVRRRADIINADLAAGRPPSTNFSLSLALAPDPLDVAALNGAMAPFTQTKHRGLFGRRK